MPTLDMASMPGFDAPALGIPGDSGTVPAPLAVAFESIDGPPEAVFRRLVARLGQEANARRVAMVSREQAAQYRVCAYVAAHVQGQKTTITWVWDVFTAGHERVARFSGEVPGALSEHAWAAADDAVIARIAQDGMGRLSVFLANTAPGRDSPPGTQGPMAYLPASRP